MSKEKHEHKEVDNSAEDLPVEYVQKTDDIPKNVDMGTTETNEVCGETIITVSTTEDFIDKYLDEKSVLIAEKIGLVVGGLDEDVGNIVMMYLMSGSMLRSGIALMCYEASGGESDDADDVAAIIEIASVVSTAKEDLLNYDYTKDINDGVKNIVDTPNAIMRGDFGFIGNAINAITGSPKAVSDCVNLAKSAVGDTVAEVWRGDYTRDSPYITCIKAENGLVMSAACRTGSEKAGNEECVELCYLYGRNIAVAYDIAEDTCKMISCVESGTLDYEMGFSIAYALDQCSANALFGDIDNKAMFKELRKNDNIEDAKLRMMLTYNKYAKAAINAARRLPDGIHRDMLMALPNYLFAGLKEEYDVEEAF